MDTKDDSCQLFIAEGHENACAYDWRYLLNCIGEGAIERDGQGDIAESGHSLQGTGFSSQGPAHGFPGVICCGGFAVGFRRSIKRLRRRPMRSIRWEDLATAVAVSVFSAAACAQNCDAGLAQKYFKPLTDGDGLRYPLTIGPLTWRLMGDAIQPVRGLGWADARG